MILALVGAIFILGMLSDATPTDMRAEAGQNFRAYLGTASPGIILAVLGVILMGVTIVIHHDIVVTDVAIYLRGPNMGAPDASEAAKAAPVLDPPPLDSPAEPDPEAADALPVAPGD